LLFEREELGLSLSARNVELENLNKLSKAKLEEQLTLNK
jgi:pantothenate synthetase